MRLALGSLAILFAASTTTAQTPTTLTVIVDGTPRPVAAASTAQLPRDSARMIFHEQPAVMYSGVPLAAVLRTVGVRSDSLRGPALATRLVVEATDGYRVVIALSELEPSLGGTKVLLADRVDGKPLPADEAPWRLIIPGDQRPARSARQVVTILVIAESR